MARDLPCATLENVTIAYTFRVREVNSLPDQSRSIRIIYSFVMLILKLSSANHTEPLRINAAFCHVTLLYTCENISARELPAFPARFADLVIYFRYILLAIYFLSNDKKLLDVVPSANYLCILPNASIIELPSIAYRPLRTNLNSTQQ